MSKEIKIKSDTSRRRPHREWERQCSVASSRVPKSQQQEGRRERECERKNRWRSRLVTPTDATRPITHVTTDSRYGANVRGVCEVVLLDREEKGHRNIVGCSAQRTWDSLQPCMLTLHAELSCAGSSQQHHAGGDLFITSLLLFVDQLAVAVASNQARITKGHEVGALPEEMQRSC